MKGAKNMSEIQNAIEVKNLKKGFGGRVLFENFSLNVKANTIHGILTATAVLGRKNEDITI